LVILKVQLNPQLRRVYINCAERSFNRYEKIWPINFDQPY